MIWSVALRFFPETHRMSLSELKTRPARVIAIQSEDPKCASKSCDVVPHAADRSRRIEALLL
jgi:hypothetical protein